MLARFGNYSYLCPDQVSQPHTAGRKTSWNPEAENTVCKDS